MYEEFETVLLKDGRFASLDNKDGPGVYTGTVGDGPRDWKIVYLTDDDIERRLTEDEKEDWYNRSVKQLKELGYEC